MKLHEHEATPLGRAFVWGGLALGWGLFNLVEGLVDHHLLELHHVRPGHGQVWWDLGFLLLGGVLVAVGVWLLRTPRPGRDT